MTLVMRTGKNAVSPRLNEKLPALWAAGVATKDIADRFGVTATTVKAHAAAMGLPSRDKRKGTE